MGRRDYGWVILLLVIGQGCSTVTKSEPELVPQAPPGVQASDDVIIVQTGRTGPKHTLWDFLGVSGAVKGVGQLGGGLLGAIKNRLSVQFPGLESIGGVTSLQDAASADTASSADQLAAEQAANDASAAQKVKTISAFENKSTWTPEEADAFADFLEDGDERVRAAACRAIWKSGLKDSVRCSGALCTAKIRAALEKLASEDCFMEVRLEARKALRVCNCFPIDPQGSDVDGDRIPDEGPPPADLISQTLGLSEGTGPAPSSAVANARAVIQAAVAPSELANTQVELASHRATLPTTLPAADESREAKVLGDSPLVVGRVEENRILESEVVGRLNARLRGMLSGQSVQDFPKGLVFNELMAIRDRKLLFHEGLAQLGSAEVESLVGLTQRTSEQIIGGDQPQVQQVIFEELLAREWSRRVVAQSVDVSQAECRQYYEQHREQFEVEPQVTWECFRVLYGTHTRSDAEKYALYCRAQVLNQPAAKPTGFVKDAVRQEVHQWTRRSELPTALAEVLFQSPLYAVSQPIDVDQSFYVVRVIGRRNELPLNDAEEEIRRELIKNKSQQFLKSYINQLAKTRYCWTIADAATSSGTVRQEQ